MSDENQLGMPSLEKVGKPMDERRPAGGLPTTRTSKCAPAQSA
jgi:hypothetical protein